MNDGELPYITVIITAYDRKRFLLKAIQSAVEQTLTKKNYEIIVIKNFTENTIDGFINQYNIKNILMDGTIGEFLYAGVSISAGEVISFLDDDDLFSKEKLAILYNTFKANINLCYFHNSSIFINDEYQKLNLPIADSIAFNMSSITVRKSILKLENLSKLDFAPDEYMYLSALDSTKSFIATREQLTYRIVNNGIAHINTDNIDEFIRSKQTINERIIKNFKIFSEIFISNEANKYINYSITLAEFSSYIYGKNVKPKNIFNIFKNNGMGFYDKLAIFFAYILVRVHYNFRYIIIKKLLANKQNIKI